MEFQSSCKKVLWMFQTDFSAFQRDFSQDFSIKGFQEIFRISRGFRLIQEGFRYISKRFQGCFETF